MFIQAIVFLVSLDNGKELIDANKNTFPDNSELEVNLPFFSILGKPYVTTNLPL